MSYFMLNEELGIQSCSIEDLKGRGIKDASITMMVYDRTVDILFLNNESSNYEVYKPLAESYLTADQKMRHRIRQQAEEITKNGLEDAFELLDNVIETRECCKYLKEAENIVSILNNMESRPYLDNWYIILQLNELEKSMEYSENFKGYLLFMYGFMLGKRAERAKRKSRYLS